MQEIHTDLQSAGGGGWGGMGFGNNPLLWLITLGFLGGRNGFFGNNEGAGTAAVANTTGIAENSAKIDCLQQGQGFLQNSLNQNDLNNRFQGLRDEVVNLEGITRDINDTMFRESAAVQRAISDCCCRLEKGQANIETAIALQTNTLTTNANNNTQRIIDQITNGRIEDLKSANDALQRQLGIAETVKQITQACGCCGPVTRPGVPASM